MASRLTLQRLPRPRDRVLALGQLVALRKQADSFRPAEIVDLGEELRLPPIGDVSRELTRLAADGLAVRLRAGGWGVTPEGEQSLLDTVGELGPELCRPSDDLSGSWFGKARHQVIPAPLAPEPWAHPIARLTERYPFDTNVLLITRFPRRDDDPVSKLITVAREACASHGLTLHVAGDKNVDPLLFNNVAAYMWACRFGLAFFEAHGDPPRKPAAINESLLIEVGGMLMTGRRCAILRDKTVARMPTDLVGHLDHPVELVDLEGTAAELHRALVQDLDSVPCSDCPGGVTRLENVTVA